MSGFVVDASVAVKWLVDEPQSALAAKLLEDDLPLMAPELIYAEAASPPMTSGTHWIFSPTLRSWCRHR